MSAARLEHWTGSLRTPTDICGHLRTPTDKYGHGSLETPTNTYGRSWTLMRTPTETNRHLWTPMDTRGNLRAPTNTNGRLWTPTGYKHYAIPCYAVSLYSILSDSAAPFCATLCFSMSFFACLCYIWRSAISCNFMSL